MRKFLGVIVFILLLLVAGFSYWKYFYTYSDGNRTGLLQKFSRKGNVFKTYEGELILSSIQSTNNMALASEKFLFSVAHKPLAEQMMTLEGKRVALHYHEKNGSLPWRGDTRYIIDSVTVLP
jgi:hypothetical protein